MAAERAVRTVELHARVKERTINATAQILPRRVIASAVAGTAVRTPVPRRPIGSLQGP